MNNYIIKASGNINDVLKQLKTIQAIFGKGVTLSDLVTLSQCVTIHNDIKKQFKNN